MSEKRFVQCEIEYGFANTTNIKKIDGVYDMQEEKTYRIEQIVDKLNEQQATIKKLQDLCGQSDGENAKLRLKNKELQEEIKLLKPTNVEQYGQIVQLQEENEQLRQKLDFYLLDEFEWKEKYGDVLDE